MTFVLAAVAAAPALVAPARADMVVLELTDPRYQPNQHIETIDASTIKAGTFVRVLDGGATRLFGTAPAAGVRCSPAAPAASS